MKPVEVHDHSLILRIVHDNPKHPSLRGSESWIELSLSQRGALFTTTEKPLGRFIFSVAKFKELAAALPAGKQGWYGEHDYVYGNRFKILGLPPMSLSWREIRVVRWMVPFYLTYRTVSLPGTFIQSIAGVAAFLQDSNASVPLTI